MAWVEGAVSDLDDEGKELDFWASKLIMLKYHLLTLMTYRYSEGSHDRGSFLQKAESHLAG